MGSELSESIRHRHRPPTPLCTSPLRTHFISIGFQHVLSVLVSVKALGTEIQVGCVHLPISHQGLHRLRTEVWT